MLELIKERPDITIPDMSSKLKISHRTVERNIKNLQEKGKLKRTGSRKTGYWEIVTLNKDV
jgi:predicted HTH transcriptional regulator